MRGFWAGRGRYFGLEGGARGMGGSRGNWEIPLGVREKRRGGMLGRRCRRGLVKYQLSHNSTKEAWKRDS